VATNGLVKSRKYMIDQEKIIRQMKLIKNERRGKQNRRLEQIGSVKRERTEKYWN
jgi:hypothetical protein